MAGFTKKIGLIVPLAVLFVSSGPGGAVAPAAAAATTITAAAAASAGTVSSPKGWC